ncbi:MAG: phage holin family protein [Chloroflexi bacterium]|nr:phage holin family protein [Chloroflexota bacterium]
MKLILRWLITAGSLYVAYLILPGITVEGNGYIVYSVMALVLGLVNALIRPILKFLSCGFIIVTLGLFVFVINAATFMLSSNISQSLGAGYSVDGFGTALLGSVIVSIVSMVLSSILIDEDKSSSR